MSHCRPKREDVTPEPILLVCLIILGSLAVLFMQYCLN